MKQIEKSILINATVDQVWQVLTDFDQYPAWNPFVVKIEGEVAEGQQIVVSLQLEGQSLQQFKPKVLVLDPQKEFRWRGKLFINGLFDGEHYFLLEKVNDQQVRLIHGERFSGLLVRPILALVLEATTQGFEAMNQAIKQQTELKYTPPSNKPA